MSQGFDSVQSYLTNLWIRHFFKRTLNLKVLLVALIQAEISNPIPMKISLKKFIIGFLVIASVFQFSTNSILGPELKFYPPDGNWYPGEKSPVAWKGTMSSIIYPVKFVFVEPLTFLAQDPDGAPPVILFFFALYWTAMALILYYVIYLFRKIMARNQKLNA